jgi:hypothetical protein
MRLLRESIRGSRTDFESWGVPLEQASAPSLARRSAYLQDLSLFISCAIGRDMGADGRTASAAAPHLRDL